jgi:hypothetical protein
MPSESCPLCQRPSDFSGADYGRRKVFHCENCTEFVITTTAELRLEQAPQKWKDDFSAKAKKAPSDKILVITVPAAPHRTDGVASVALNGEYEPRES